MDRSMASSLPTEKLDRTNYASWSYKMHQYLLGHGYWSYVEGANDAAPESTHRDFPAWEQSVSRILYCFASCVGEQLLSYIRDAQTPKGAWENLKKIFAANTIAKKLWQQGSSRSTRLSSTTNASSIPLALLKTLRNYAKNCKFFFFFLLLFTLTLWNQCKDIGRSIVLSFLM